MNDLEAFILIGGRSARMGTDKYELQLGGRTFLEIARSTLSAAGLTNISVVSNGTEPVLPQDFTYISDLVPNRGALSGVHAAFSSSRSTKTLVLACDYPFVTAEFLTFLIDRAAEVSEFDAIVPLQPDGRVQPLCAVYSTVVCRDAAARLVGDSSQNPSMRSLLESVRTGYLPFAEYANLPGAEKLFINVNTPGDYQSALETEG